MGGGRGFPPVVQWSPKQNSSNSIRRKQQVPWGRGGVSPRPCYESQKEKQMLECGGIKLRTITSEVYESQATMGGRSPEKANLKKSNTKLGKSGIFNGSILSKQANFQNQDDNQVETANIEMAYICRYNQERI